MDAVTGSTRVGGDASAAATCFYRELRAEGFSRRGRSVSLLRVDTFVSGLVFVVAMETSQRAGRCC